jgi:predicted glycosyltransferase
VKIFFYFGHPSQFHFYKNIVKVLKEKGNEIHIYIKSKDVLETLLKDTRWKYTNIQKKKRGRSKWAIIFSLIKRDIFLSAQVIKHKPELLVASDPSFSHIGYLFRIPCLNFMDDDFDAAGYYANITYPFTNTIITPDTVKMGKWEQKRIPYKGYMKLAYLHPNWFSPDSSRIGYLKDKKYFLIRLSGLQAHHDSDKKGIHIALLSELIDKLSSHGQVIISHEGTIADEYIKYVASFPESDMHHYLSYSKMLVSDSQSMSGEAAMLGVPSVRISSFKSKLSVLEELEHQYGLTYAFYPEDEKGILGKIEELLGMKDLKFIFQQRRQKILEDKIDVTAFSIWFIENFPKSRKIMQENPKYAERFS